VSAKKARIVLADDHAVIREGLRLLLEQDARLEVVAEAADADSALRYVRGHRPDVLVLDLNMPGRDSLEVIPEVLDAEARVVVLTMQQEPSFARAALRAGAAAYVLKDAAHTSLLDAIEAALAGGTYVDPSIGARLATEPEEEAGWPDGLTEREVEVLRLLALGHTNAEVAGDLGISPRTVETHRSHIQQKTDRGARSGLVRYALDHGLLP
jgi:two-component system, NarL family, response regulator NreC